jgi:hypothetical protein
LRHGQSNVVATIELKLEKYYEELHSKDMGKCVLLTCLSALDLRQLGRVMCDIVIPFVLGDQRAAVLFVTCLFKGSNIPQVMEVGKYFFSQQDQRVTFFATLAVFIAHAMKVFQNEAIERLKDALHGVNPKHYLDYFVSRSVKSGHTDTSTERTDEDSNKRQRGTDDAGDVYRVALCSGSISNLVAVKIYGMESPFYFTGDYYNKEKNHVKVFCKVWHVVEKYKTRKHFISEIKYLHTANKLGVPCPQILENLTLMDIEYENKMYHRLVMTYHQQDRVDASALTDYAISLISAVAKLHEHGILHCDIKPLNIAWNSQSKKIFILDFGLTNHQKFRMVQPHIVFAQIYSVLEKH